MRHGSEEGPPIGPQVIFGVDADGTCTMSTGNGLADLGVRPGELVGQNLLALYDEPAREYLHRVLAGETFSVERTFDGRRLWIYLEPVRDSVGTVTGAVGVSTDVTEQRRVEAEVRASRERASLLADVSAAFSKEVFDLEALLRVGVRSATEAVADVGSIWLRGAKTNRVELRAVWTGDEHDPALLEELTTRATPGELPSFEVGPDAPGKPELLDLGNLDHLAVSDRTLLRRGMQRFGLVWLLRVPLRARGVFRGFLDVARGPSKGAFGEDEIALVSDVAERCALALDNALLLEAQRSSREELEKFRALADASDNFIAIADTDGRPTYVNPRLRKASRGIPCPDVWVGAITHAGEPVVTEIRRAVASAGRWSGDAAVSAALGELTVHGEVFQLAHPDTGTPLGTAWIGQDVTDVRETERALHAAVAEMKQFKALVDASPAFIAIAGLDGKVMYVNPPGRAMIGMDDDVDVTKTAIPDYLTPEGLDASLNVEQPAVIAHGHWEGQSTLRNHRGPPIPVAITSFLIPDPDTGEPWALATVQLDISDRLRAEAALQELADQREALLTRLVDAQDVERARIAADVHDDPVQALAAVDVQLGSVTRRLREQEPDLVEILEPLKSSVSGAMNRLRALLFDLEPPDLQHGLAPALRRAAGEIFGSTSTRWTVEGDEEPEVPEATRAVAYRIAKEALANVHKHAHAKHVVVQVRAAQGGLSLSVEDDGVGLGRGRLGSVPGHRGILTMQDRAAAAGGRCTIGNRPAGGTVVAAWLPGCTRV